MLCVLGPQISQEESQTNHQRSSKDLNHSEGQEDLLVRTHSISSLYVALSQMSRSLVYKGLKSSFGA